MYLLICIRQREFQVSIIVVKQVLQNCMHQLRIVGDYQVLRVLVSSSQSFFYKVKSNNQIFRLTAVPLSIPASPTQNQLQLLQRLLRKCQKYKQISHPNVEKIHDVFYFQENGLHFFAIVGEYSTDKDLEDLIQEDNRINLKELKQVMIDLCSALDYLQKSSIIHSNINPENIRKIGQNYKITFPTFKEIRWFNSKSENKSQNKVSAADCYISPEFKGGIIYSSSTDVWSIGIIFYEMLSGRQFKFDSTKLPCQMGNFTEAMLSGVPNAMMRSMLKEMLNIDNKARINIGRVKNIITNTDISQINSDIQEEITENIQFQILSLPIFVTQVIKQSEKHQKNVQKKIDLFEFQIDGFSITIVYKPNNKLLDFCIYKNEQDYSFHIEYAFQNLPSTFLAIFNNTQQIFGQLKQQRLKIAAINLFGDILFSLEDVRYQMLKTVRQQQLLKQKMMVSSNINYKNQMKNQDNLLWYMKEGKQKMSYDDIINKNISQKQKFLNELLKSDKNFDNLQNIVTIGETIFRLYYQQQNYDRCMQLNETLLPYFSRYPTHMYVGRTIGRLIACSELLNDNQLTLKWRQILHSKYAEQTIVSYLYTSMRLYDSYLLYLQNGRQVQSNIILMKLKQYTVFIASELDSHRNLGDLTITRLMPLLTQIFTNYYIHLYQVSCLILTQIYNQLKSSALPSNKATVKTILSFVKQKIKISAIKAPVLYQALTHWLKVNNPEQYANLPKSVDFSDFDYLSY